MFAKKRNERKSRGMRENQEEGMERLSRFLEDFHGGKSQESKVSFGAVISDIISLKRDLKGAQETTAKLSESKLRLEEYSKSIADLEKNISSFEKELISSDTTIALRGIIVSRYTEEELFSSLSEEEKQEVLLKVDELRKLKENRSEIEKANRPKIEKVEKQIAENKAKLAKLEADIEKSEQEINDFFLTNKVLIANLRSFEEVMSQEKVGMFKNSFPKTILEYIELELSAHQRPYVAAVDRASKKVAERRAAEVSRTTQPKAVSSEDFSQSGATLHEGASRHMPGSPSARTRSHQSKVGSPSL